MKKSTPRIPGRGRRQRVSRSRFSMSFAKGAVWLLCLSGVSCASDKNEEDAPDALFYMDGKPLTLHEVVGKIPVGIEPVDSAALFDKIVDDWLETAVLSDLAESKLPDIEDIESKVAAYRNRLIVSEYLRLMKEKQGYKVSEDSIRSYYDAHRRELLTESPLIKGVYMKVPTSISGIDEIKRLIFSSTEEDIDRLEKNWMESALQYDYFAGNWIDWQTLADQIPYRFHNPDVFLENNRDFETDYDGSTYIFHITDYIPTGSEQPYDFASGEISSLLERARLASYEEALVGSLVKKAVDDKRLVAADYDPLRRAFVAKKPEKNKKDTE